MCVMCVISVISVMWCVKSTEELRKIYVGVVVYVRGVVVRCLVWRAVHWCLVSCVCGVCVV